MSMSLHKAAKAGIRTSITGKTESLKELMYVVYVVQDVTLV